MRCVDRAICPDHVMMLQQAHPHQESASLVSAYTVCITHDFSYDIMRIPCIYYSHSVGSSST